MTIVSGIVATWVNKLDSIFKGRREGVLKNYFYVDDDIFKAEQNLIFNKLWIFVGLTVEFPKVGSWIVRKITNKEILVVFDGSNFFAHEKFVHIKI